MTSYQTGLYQIKVYCYDDDDNDDDDDDDNDDDDHSVVLKIKMSNYSISSNVICSFHTSMQSVVIITIHQSN